MRYSISDFNKTFYKVLHQPFHSQTFGGIIESHLCDINVRFPQTRFNHPYR